jgi:uncharacterized phage protein gp47/JayE
MTTYVTADGLTLPTYAEIFAGIEARLRADVDPAIDLTAASPDGQIVGAFSAALRDAWEGLAYLHTAYDPNDAQGVYAENIAALTGTTRMPATASYVTVAVTHDAGYSAAEGEIVAHVSGYPDRVFTNAAIPVQALAGTVNCVFTCTETGPVPAPAGTLTVIDSSPTGTTAITNAADATLGSDEETDEELNLRRVSELYEQGSSAEDSLAAALQDEDNDPTLAYVLSVKVYSNRGDGTDAWGLPPHSFQVMLDDNGGDVADSVIGQVLWDHMPAGIRSYGATSATATDSDGNSQTVYFDRPTQVPVYVSITVSGNPDPDAVEAAIKAEIDQYKPGDSVQALMLVGRASRVDGVTAITAYALGTAPAPVATGNITIARDERAIVDLADISVTVS